MTRPCLTLDARLAIDKYDIDKESHIRAEALRCKACTLRPCLTVCPAEVYRWVDNRLVVRYENCLECGTCQIACERDGNGGLDWSNPQYGSGIQYRYG